MRPGCDRPAVTRLSYDTVSCRVWLDPLPDRQGPAQEICSLHSSRLTVPRGWMLCDRRDALDVAEVSPRFSTAAPVVVPVPVSVDDSEDRPEAPAETAGSSPPEVTSSSASPGAAEQRMRPATRRVARTTPVAVSDRHDVVVGSPGERVDLEGPDMVSVEVQVELDVEVDVDVELEVESPAEPAVQAVEPGETPGDTAVSEESGDEEDLPELLRASSPLLSRAFRATGPQRSVLTQSLYDESD
jgi:hypothetical protein